MGSVNEKAKQFWSGEGGDFWVENQEELDITLEPLGEATLKNIDLSSCDSILDIGCGTGRTTIDIAKRLAAHGKATGLDISEPMLEQAKILAQAEGVENVRFECVDVQVESLGDTRFAIRSHVFRRPDAGFFEYSLCFERGRSSLFRLLAITDGEPLAFSSYGSCY